jgi:VWFA-related protein
MRGLLTLSGSLTLLFLFSIAPSLAQAPAQADDTQSPPTFRTRTNLVLVPALVQTDKGQVVFALTAQDFSITDDGVPQKLTLEQDTDSLPLALVIVVETGAAGANRVGLYSRIGPLLDSVVGGVNHRVAVVGFDSVPRLVEDFTPDLDQVRGTMNNLKPGDDGDAIFDSLGYAVELLRKQPVQYRRAILLLSETLDHGSKMSLEDTLRAISDTNTAIYSMGFSTTRAQMKGEAKGFSDPDDPGPAGGCMSRPKKASDKETAEDDDDDDDKPYSGRDTETPPAKQKSVAAQAYDCASLLAPPLRAAKMLAIAAMNGLHRNVPESVAQLTGGEYYKFENEKSFQRGLFTIANHVPNRYVLSFQPQSPHAGLHELKVQVTDYKKLDVTARRSYWVDAETQP